MALKAEECFSDAVGESWDLDLYEADRWLMDSAVIDHLCPKKGMWEISLVFVCTKEPFKIIKRTISTENNKRKAELVANIFRRQAAKDPRGTFKVDTNFMEFCMS